MVRTKAKVEARVSSKKKKEGKKAERRFKGLRS